MRVVQSRFLRGPNVHRMAPCFVSELDFQGHRAVGLAELPPEGAFLRTLMPNGATKIAGAAGWARLTSRLLFATQVWAGSPAASCQVVSLAPTATGRFRLVCAYEYEDVAEHALRLSVDVLEALFNQQSLDLDSRLAVLRAQVEACAVGSADQALLALAQQRGIPVVRLEDAGRGFAIGWGNRQRRLQAAPSEAPNQPHSLDDTFAEGDDGRIPVVAVTGTNGKTTTTQLIAHVIRASGVRTGVATTQGIYIDRKCVQKGDCSGYWSARKVLNDRTVEVAILETARGGILKRGLGFDRCDVGIVLNVSSDHLGLDGIETLQDLAQVKGLVARCARVAAVLNADDALCVEMRESLAPGCKPVFFTMDPLNRVLVRHLLAGGDGAFLDDDGWLVWCSAGDRSKVVRAADLPFTLQGRARYNTANALAALAALSCMGYASTAVAGSLTGFVSDAKSNPLRANQFEVDGVKLFVDYAHNVVAYRALCDTARSMLEGSARLLGVVTSPGDRRSEDLFATGRVCGDGFDELVVYEQDPRGRAAGFTIQEILRGARSAAPGKLLRGEPGIREALRLGLTAAKPGDVLVFTCAGSFDDLVEGVRLKSPAAADRIAREVSQ